MSSYDVVPRQPEPMHLLDRGNPAAKREVVAAGGVASLRGVNAEVGLPPGAPEERRRIKLAEWIAAPRNPLFARVIANRLWHYHFGIGIVETPNDFGFNGGRPTHPRVLDRMAVDLRRGGWSLKRLQRAIVLSATFRQGSRHNPAAARLDAGNRLLWRKSPMRLEAEAVRDAMLTVCGRLNRAVGGPAYRDFKTYVNNTQFYEMIDPIGAPFNRRTIYRMWVRSGRNPFLDVFDCPDPSTTAPKRAATLTPLSALAMLNNSFVLRMADRFAQRARTASRAYRLAFGRAPDAAERAEAEAFVRAHGLPALCRALFNANEFMYVD